MTPRRRILIFGANGQVGHELARELEGLGEVVALGRGEADLSAVETLPAIIQRVQPTVVINAAAYTAVDKAEDESELAQTVNGAAPGAMASAAEAIGACFVHYSTDYVFDGRKPAPYTETDKPNPLSVYGRTKLAGETAVAGASRRHLVFRASWVFGAHGANFLKTMLRLARERETLRVVADQVGAPTSASLIADVTRQTLVKMMDASADDSRWGLYNLAAGGETSWHGYARYVLDRAAQLGESLRANPGSVVPITTADYPVRATRPANSRLETMKLRAAFGLELPHWTDGVNRVLEQMHGPSR